jgi:hypothetical protein
VSPALDPAMPEPEAAGLPPELVAVIEALARAHAAEDYATAQVPRESRP